MRELFYFMGKKMESFMLFQRKIDGAMKKNCMRAVMLPRKNAEKSGGAV